MVLFPQVHSNRLAGGSRHHEGLHESVPSPDCGMCGSVSTEEASAPVQAPAARHRLHGHLHPVRSPSAAKTTGQCCLLALPNFMGWLFREIKASVSHLIRWVLFTECLSQAVFPTQVYSAWPLVPAHGLRTQNSWLFSTILHQYHRNTAFMCFSSMCHWKPAVSGSQMPHSTPHRPHSNHTDRAPALCMAACTLGSSGVSSCTIFSFT